ncbi:hypothetical protein I5L01_02175 [Erythrobacter sp. YJ-T3-07]|uniref:hypothetical protein n=1 Tax=Erythrobacter sp. YJ-T3-07 TaxID=2793063 RepID=UPI0018D3AAD4|nr:hypothetical protein [Erythrobacter sp. YJ-T3-07]MBH1943029.1 hypothetical protein [Erythrobacter sp. YJ-T3-07]
MQLMIILSLLLNVAVLVPVTGSLILRAGWIEAAYGPATPARGILLSIYLAILVASVVLLFYPLPQMVAALLAVQVIYKITTPFTADWRNPVVLSNLAIAAVHAITVWLVLPGIAN